ncbi:hypothetical protein ACU686_14635 [Yinghuangia aomiensis]
MIGNFVAGAALSRHVHRSVLTIAAAMTAAMPLFLLLGRTAVGGAILLIVWGLAFGGVSVGLQTWVLKAAPQSVEAASRCGSRCSTCPSAVARWPAASSSTR